MISKAKAVAAVSIAAALLLALAPSAFATPYHPYLSQITGTDTPATGFGGFVCGTTVDANGAVYVGDANNNVIDVFDTSGAYLTQISDPALSGPCGLAVDSSGNVYVRNLNLGNVVEFNPSAFPVTGSTTYSINAHLGESSPGANDGNGVLDSSSPTGVAVNPANDHPFVAESTQVQEYDTTGAAVGSPFGSGDIAQSSGLAVRANGDVYLADPGANQVEIFSGGSLSSSFNASDSPSGGFGGPSGVAFDPGTSHVYVTDPGNGVVDEFDAGGAYVARITAFQTPAGFFSLADPSQVAVDRSGGANDGHVYVTDDFNNVVDVFDGTTQNSTPPTAAIDLPSSITGTSAHLSGTVNPEGLDTKWHFEYSTDDANWTPVGSDQDAGSGSSDVPVATDLTGLQPNSHYFVRLVASNGLDPAVDSPEQSFDTLAVPPLITNDVIFNLTPSSTTIRADVNDFNAQLTDCHFELGTDTSYGTSVPCAETVAAGPDPAAVSAHLSGLAPGTAYHYRLDATSVGGTTDGPDASFTTPDPTTPTCTNDALRTGPSANLPDCRAYEQVSPPDKQGQNVFTNSFQTRVAAAGDRVLYTSLGGFADVHGLTVGTAFLAQRGAAGWQTHNVFPQTPPTSFTFLTAGMYPGYLDADPSLATGVFFSPWSLTDDPNTKDVGNLYLRTDLTTPGPGSWQLASPCPVCTSPLPPPTPSKAFFSHHIYVGASTDLSHLVFESPRQLTAGAPGDCAGDNVADRSLCPLKLYDYHDGTLELASVLPDGSPSAGQIGAISASGQDPSAKAPHAVSADGSRIVFQGPDGNLYQRVGDSSTIQLNASERTTTPDPNGPQPAAYADASADGTRVFFTTTEELTDGADTHVGPGDNPQQSLYMYDANAPAGHHLTFISADQSGAPAFDVLGTVGASADGSYLYWLQPGRLVANQVPRPEDLADDVPNLYLWHDGEVRFIAHLSGGLDLGGDANTGDAGNIPAVQSRVSPDGRSLLFTTADAVGPTGVQQSGTSELYLYRAPDDALACVSCRPGGAASTGGASDTAEDPFNSNTWDPYHLSHALTSDGRYAFFSTAEKLVPEDTNGAADAYEYDSQTGQVHLLSSSTDPGPSLFLDATPDGSDVVITSFQGLVAQDADSANDAYDVRVDGGLAAQNQPPPPPPCTDPATCQGSGSGAPGLPGSGTSGFTGPGNQGKALGGVNAPKKKKKCRKRHSKHHKCKRSRRANVNRGGTK